MPTTLLPSFLPRRLAAVLFVALALVLFVGCDSGGGLDDEDAASVDPEETAGSIAQSLAESTGGTADELGDAAAIVGGAASSTAKSVSHSRDCSYDDGTQVWTCVVDVEGARGRIDTVDFDRTYRVQFFGAGEVVRRSAEADSMTFEMVEGRGRFETVRIDHSHELLPATWSLRATQDDTYAVDLLSDEAGRNVSEDIAGRRDRTRSREAQVRKTRVEGLVFREGGGLVAGTIEGTYDADVEIERTDGDTVSRSVSVSYVATFSETGAEIAFTGGGERFNGESFEFNRTTGELE
jgi:hypothetical protein